MESGWSFGWLWVAGVASAFIRIRPEVLWRLVRANVADPFFQRLYSGAGGFSAR